VCVCVFNETVSNRLYTIKRLVTMTMNNELGTEWVTGMPHRRPENLTSYSDVIWLYRTCAFELLFIKRTTSANTLVFVIEYVFYSVLLLRFG